MIVVICAQPPNRGLRYLSLGMRHMYDQTRGRLTRISTYFEPSEVCMRQDSVIVTLYAISCPLCIA